MEGTWDCMVWWVVWEVPFVGILQERRGELY